MVYDCGFKGDTIARMVRSCEKLQELDISCIVSDKNADTWSLNDVMNIMTTPACHWSIRRLSLPDLQVQHPQQVEALAMLLLLCNSIEHMRLVMEHRESDSLYNIVFDRLAERGFCIHVPCSVNVSRKEHTLRVCKCGQYGQNENKRWCT